MMARLFHLSDLHFGREDAAALRWFAATVAREKPDAVICTGDLTMRARKREFAAACHWLESLGVPVSIEPGNHDLPYFNPIGRLIDPYRRFRAVERAIERPLALPGVMLVPLKTTARFQLRNLSHGRVSRGGLTEALNALRARPPATVTLVACHHPLVRPGEGKRGSTHRGEEALRALAACGADVVLSGHVHDPFDTVWHHAGRKVRLVGAGTLSERLRATRPSFNELSVENGGLAVRVRMMPT